MSETFTRAEPLQSSKIESKNSHSSPAVRFLQPTSRLLSIQPAEDEGSAIILPGENSLIFDDGLSAALPEENALSAAEDGNRPLENSSSLVFDARPDNELPSASGPSPPLRTALLGHQVTVLEREVQALLTPPEQTKPAAREGKKPSEHIALGPAAPSRKKRALRIISNAVFYAVMFLLIGGAAFYVLSVDGARDIGGYSCANVLSDSMQSEIPKGSFVLVSKVDPGQLKIGDDITFVTPGDVTFTHRIINVYEDYGGSGQRGFQTQGVDNPAPDQDIVYAKNVVGRVVFHVPQVGFYLSFIQQHVLLVVGLFALLMLLTMTLSALFGRGAKSRQTAPVQNPDGKPITPILPTGTAPPAAA